MNILYVPGVKGRTIEPCDTYIPASGMQYYGFATPEGHWVIMRGDPSVADTVAYRYATNSNNTAYKTYSDAWTAKASLDYDYFYKVKI